MKRSAPRLYGLISTRTFRPWRDVQKHYEEDAFILDESFSLFARGARG